VAVALVQVIVEMKQAGLAVRELLAVEVVLLILLLF
jgi:hypothetical protein